MGIYKSSKNPMIEHIKDLTVRKKMWNPSDEERVASYNIFMINRWLSMNELILPIVEVANGFKNISKENHFNYYFSKLNKMNYFCSYMKAKENPNKGVLKILCKYYECGMDEAEYKLKVIPKEYIQKIVKFYDRSLVVI